MEYSPQDLVRRRMLQENSHSIWKLIFLNELSRARVLNTPAPFDAGEAEMTRYVEDHIIAVDAAYEVTSFVLAGMIDV